jgi:hypothetical protein
MRLEGCGETKFRCFDGARARDPLCLHYHRDLNGKVCALGADFQIVRPDSSIELEAKYALETDDGAVIYVENRGIRRGPIELIQKLNRGEAVDPALIYFRTVPRFETGAARYRWLMQSVFVASAARHTDRVVIDVHQVL